MRWLTPSIGPLAACEGEHEEPDDASLHRRERTAEAVVTVPRTWDSYAATSTEVVP